ncbi:Hypothetical predicted protein [Octopus vulgaris]|uniref:Uncharacterized protein n=1 Tax=Octopus vulgaris TaxID=6645 RepID=A0AA36FDB7_OCTVU|nr:Hypothetical predicted protein [Octopus vulgaris]
MYTDKENRYEEDDEDEVNEEGGEEDGEMKPHPFLIKLGPLVQGGFRFLLPWLPYPSLLGRSPGGLTQIWCDINIEQDNNASHEKEKTRKEYLRIFNLSKPDDKDRNGDFVVVVVVVVVVDDDGELCKLPSSLFDGAIFTLCSFGDAELKYRCEMVNIF